MLSSQFPIENKLELIITHLQPRQKTRRHEPAAAAGAGRVHRQDEEEGPEGEDVQLHDGGPECLYEGGVGVRQREDRHRGAAAALDPERDQKLQQGKRLHGEQGQHPSRPG